MTPTRAALERLIETWRQEAKQLRAMAEAELHNLDFRDEWGNRARELDRCADELAALLTSEGPAPTPREPSDHWCVTVESSGVNLVTIEPRILAGKPDFTPHEEELIRTAAQHLLAFIGQPAQRPETPTVGTCATCRHWNDDGESGECNNADSPMFRVYVASDREPWADDFGCILHEHKPAEGPETPADTP